MGVRGLKSFLENENKTRKVDIAGAAMEKVKMFSVYYNAFLYCICFFYIRQNPNIPPILVIDFYSLANWTSRWDQKGNICGGRHEKILMNWTSQLRQLKSTGCSLVFFHDLKTEESKVQMLLTRRTYDHKISVKLYDVV